MTRSALDLSHAAMLAGDEAEARAFYRFLADAPLCLLLNAPADGDQLQPQVFELSDGPVILAFDSEERLAAFQDSPQPYAVLPGRVIAQAVAGQGVSLGLNLGSGAESETLLPPEVLAHLLALLDVSSDVMVGQARRFEPPQVPPAAQVALAASVQAAGLVAGAVLAAVIYDTGARGHILALIGANPTAEPALAQAMAEALSFAGLEAAALDVVFLSAEDPALRRIAAVGHAFEIIQPVMPDAPTVPRAPGSDPDRPPRLR
jgi:hypothetical protein